MFCNPEISSADIYEQGSIVSAIGRGINAIISAIANIIMTIISAIVSVRHIRERYESSHPHHPFSRFSSPSGT